MTVRTYWALVTSATLRLLSGSRGAGALTGEGREAGHIVSPRAQLVLVVVVVVVLSSSLRRLTAS